MTETRAFGRRIGALEEVFQFLGAFGDREGFDERLQFAIQFVAEELFTNMVKYNTGQGREIEIRIARADGEVRLELVDFDVDPWDPTTAPEVDIRRPAEDRRPGGLGMHLVKSMVDRVTYEYRDRAMCVTVAKRLPSDGSSAGPQQDRA
ncbi:MAG TPA: ATP-binding protein [Thermoanaerobaculia bacterium]|nr:ATP-binding protein [Thermoanaerobaculia bacterium]